MRTSYQIVDGWMLEGQICSCCHEWKPLEDYSHIFGHYGCSDDQTQRYHYCKECANKKAIAKYNKNKK